MIQIPRFLLRKTAWSIALFLALCVQGQALAQAPADSSREVTLETPTGGIQGTLSYAGPSVVLVIPGSGPTDRDGNGAGGLRSDAYKQLADSLASHGISTLRFDKRGIAGSAASMSSENDIRFEHYIEDAAAWIRYLREDGRFDQVVVLGHSEGSLIGMVAARTGKADGFVSVAGPGRPAAQLLRDQLKEQLPSPLREESFSYLDSLEAGRTVEVTSPMLASLFRPSVQPYMISWFRYDPTAELRKLTVPVLVLQGSNDLQVPESDARLLHEALPASRLVVIRSMNHILKSSPSEPMANYATYLDPALPLAPGLVSALVDFVRHSGR